MLEEVTRLLGREVGHDEATSAMLRQAGIDAANMEGGMLEWKAEDLPITDPGAYRVEARIAGRLWLLSNPVHLR